MRAGLIAVLMGFSVAAMAAEPVKVVDAGPGMKEVLVKWNGLALTRADFEASLEKLPQDYREQLRGDMKRVTALLENLLIMRSLADEARKAKLDSEPLVREQIALETDRVLGKLRVDRLRSALTLPDLRPAAREYYKANPKEFEVPERVQAAHVLIGLSKKTPEEALDLAKEVRALALSGTPFEDLAVQYSDDSSAKQNKGNLGFFTRGKMVKEFEAAAFGLAKPGDVSEVVKTAFGFHVIKLLAKEPGRVKTYEEVEKELLLREEEKYRNARVQEHLSKIKNNPSIEINKEALDRLTGKPSTK